MLPRLTINGLCVTFGYYTDEIEHDCSVINIHGQRTKSADKRNFEAGIITDEKEIVGKIMEQFDKIWRGEHCRECKRKRFCADYKDLLLK